MLVATAIVSHDMVAIPVVISVYVADVRLHAVHAMVVVLLIILHELLVSMVISSDADIFTDAEFSMKS